MLPFPNKSSGRDTEYIDLIDCFMFNATFSNASAKLVLAVEEAYLF
jgi:hypothetical protein